MSCFTAPLKASQWRRSSVPLTTMTSDVAVVSSSPPPSFSKLLVSGFLSKQENFAQPFVFTKLFESDQTRWKSIAAATDDVSFAKKRMVSPSSVYNGLYDVLEYCLIGSDADMEGAVQGKDAWLAFNVTVAQVTPFAELAVKSGVKRLVLGVHVPADMRGPDMCFEDAQKLLTEAGVAFTIVKFGDVRKMGEAKYPYRIMRGALPLPEASDYAALLSSEDLMRVLVECVDIPKAFNHVYGIGPGSKLDAEILVYMKSMGWPERVQVGMLLGDVMERVEAKYLEEKRKELDAPASKTAKPDEPAKRSKFAGFFV